MSKDYDTLKKEMGEKGISKTIYALVTPETEAGKNRIFDGNLREELERLESLTGGLNDVDAIIKTVHRARANYMDQFRGAWTGKQDEFHRDFFNTWLEWSKPIAPIEAQDFTYRYPTAGASEGLSASISEYGNRARAEKFDPTIFTFTGEYEGYQAYAKACHIPTTQINRDDWREMVDAIAAASKDHPVQFYISQPSAIDGNLWEHYDEFMTELAKKAPNAEVVLDLTYVGCISNEAHIKTDYPNITSIAFSLSKPMGAYYDRIGGFLSKRPNDALFGNQWFKNITSLNFGLEFIRSHDVYELPRKYAPLQQEVIDQLAHTAKSEPELGALSKLQPSDVYMLACGPMPKNPSEEEQFLGRLDGSGNQQIRACLSPAMARMIGTAPMQEMAQKEQDGRGR